MPQAAGGGTAKDSADQWAILAILRFFLASVVVLGHCYQFAGGGDDWTYIGLFFNQGFAVFGFFILSGFSIAASLERETSHYYWRRFARIWPLYICCIISGSLIALYFPDGVLWHNGQRWHPAAEDSIIASLLMLQGFTAPAIPIVGQIWSLSIEWWLYMVAPLLKKLPLWPLVTLGVVSILLFIKINHSPEQYQHGFGLLTLSWLWLTGFVYYRYKGTPIGFVILTFPSIAAWYFLNNIWLPVLITILVVTLCNEYKLSRPVRWIFNFLGDISYPLYLCHTIVMALCLLLGITQTFPMVMGSLLVAAAALYLIDYPSRRFLRRLWDPSTR